jgi:hypothetical protein
VCTRATCRPWARGGGGSRPPGPRRRTGALPRPRPPGGCPGASFGREEEPIARGLVRDNMGRADPNKGYLDDQPISLYTSANVPGKTAATGKNMFAKNAAFSSRVEDFYGGGEVKDL